MLEKEEFVEKLRQAGMRPIANGYIAPPLRNPQLEMMEMDTERLRNEPTTNRDWLHGLSTVELVDWIKNTASAMSDAELLKWLEEKHNG